MLDDFPVISTAFVPLCCGRLMRLHNIKRTQREMSCGNVKRPFQLPEFIGWRLLLIKSHLLVLSQNGLIQRGPFAIVIMFTCISSNANRLGRCWKHFPQCALQLNSLLFFFQHLSFGINLFH